MQPGLRRVTTRAALLLLWLTLLTACGADQPAGPTPPPDGSVAQATATTGVSGNAADPTPTSAADNASPTGIDMSKVDPCALLTREEAEEIMGPLDWKVSPRSKRICDYAVTTEKFLSVRLMEPNGWLDEFHNLEGPGTSLIPRHEVGLSSEVAVRYNDSRRANLPPLCQLELPCVIAHEAPIPEAGSVWMTLTAIMPDRSAFQIRIYPQNVDQAKQMAQKGLGRLPMK